MAAPFSRRSRRRDRELPSVLYLSLVDYKWCRCCPARAPGLASKKGLIYVEGRECRSGCGADVAGAVSASDGRPRSSCPGAVEGVSPKFNVPLSD